MARTHRARNTGALRHGVGFVSWLGLRASIFHYHFVRTSPSTEGIEAEINTAHLRAGAGFGRVADVGLGEIRAALRDAGIECFHRAAQEGAA